MNNLICNAKASHYQSVIAENKEDPKKLFSVVNKLLGKKEGVSLRSNEPVGQFVNSFGKFFIEKINKIYSGNDSNGSHSSHRATCTFDKWDPVTHDELHKINMAA